MVDTQETDGLSMREKKSRFRCVRCGFIRRQVTLSYRACRRGMGKLGRAWSLYLPDRARVRFEEIIVS